MPRAETRGKVPAPEQGEFYFIFKRRRCRDTLPSQQQRALPGKEPHKTAWRYRGPRRLSGETAWRTGVPCCRSRLSPAPEGKGLKQSGGRSVRTGAPLLRPPAALKELLVTEARKGLLVQPQLRVPVQAVRRGATGSRHS